MRAPPNLNGFTLIELMVVIAIMVTVMTLVGNGVVKGVAKARVQAEIISVYRQVEKAGVYAFVSGQSLQLHFDGHTAVLTDKKNNVVSSSTYDHLVFDAQTINFSRNGLPDQFQLVIDQGDVARTLELGPLFKGNLSEAYWVNSSHVAHIS